MPSAPGAGQGAAVAAAPPSISDSWTYFKAHGTLPVHEALIQVLPVQVQDPDQGEASPARGAVGGDGRRGKEPVPPLHQARVTDPYPATVPTDNHLEDSAFLLTGTGQEGSETCGQVRSWAVCRDHPGDHPRIKRGQSCGWAGCPVCWPTWAHRAADRAGSRLEAYGSLHGVGRLAHYTFNPPEGTAPSWEAFYQVMRQAGGRGGAVLRHPCRTRETTPERKWERLLRRADWRMHIRESTHFHTISGRIPMKSSTFYEKTGWTYKRIRPLEDREDIERVLFYLLSHVQVTGQNVIRYFGRCHFSHLRIKHRYCPILPLRCPVCGAPMVLEVDGVLTAEEATRRKTMHTYQVAGPPVRVLQ